MLCVLMSWHLFHPTHNVVSYCIRLATKTLETLDIGTTYQTALDLAYFEAIIASRTDQLEHEGKRRYQASTRG